MQVYWLAGLRRSARVAVFLLVGGSVWAQNPTVTDGGVVNAASFANGQAVAPGSLVSVFGSNLASSLALADSVPLSITLNNVTVTFNGISAPIQFVSSGQINAQLPWNAMPDGMNSANINVVVQNNGANSLPKTVAVAQFSPGLFSIPPGAGYAVAVNSDGTIAAPPGTISGFTTHAARPGDALILYANGLGPVTPPDVDGSGSMDTLRYTVTQPAVYIGGVQAQVTFSGLSPQFPGVNQVNIVVPNVGPGDQLPLQIEIGGIRSTAQVVIAISQ